MSGRMFILMHLLSEETISSWFTRSAMASGFSSLLDPWRMCTGAHSYPAVVFPDGLDRLSAALGIEDREVLPLEHTPILAYRPFVNARTYREALTTMRADPKPRGETSTRLPSKHSRSEFRFCPECVVEDIKKNGAAYVHRHHCMQGVYVCIKHKCLLSSGCGECRWSAHKTSKIRYPDTICQCGSALRNSIGVVSNDEFNLLYRLSIIINDFLNLMGPGDVTRWQVGSAYREAFSSSRRKTDSLAEFINNRIGENLIERMNISIRGNMSMSAALYGAGNPVSSLVINSIFVETFFGGVESLIHSATEFEILASEGEIERCRGVLKKLVETDAARSRQDLSKKAPQEYGVVKNFDEYWIKMILGFMRDWSVRDLKKIDQGLMRHMRQSLIGMRVGNKYPIKITKNRLIWGYPCFKHIAPLISKLPQSLRYIRENIDSSEYYLCKVVRFIMLNDHDPTLTPEQKVKRLGVPVEVARNLAAGGLPPRGREPSAIKHIIALRRASKRSGHKRCK
ncbi:TniQ protein [Paraburkholderia steynii]|uniref:TniQ protein n=2 Tax=Paraburkholderia steynii TaxID=1245441 RepID=A0A7Z7FMM7_9BURK|nr:TniQ protein [Paraburkholderia steynii]